MTPECGSTDPHAPHGFHREPDLSVTWWCLGARSLADRLRGVADALDAHAQRAAREVDRG